MDILDDIGWSKLSAIFF